MRRVDDCVEVVDPEHPEVGNRKAAALIFMRRKLAVTRAGSEVFHLGREGRERFAFGVLQDRREETAFDGHGDSNVGGLQLENTIPGPDGIGVRHGLQRQGAGLDDEIVDRQLHTARFKLFVQIAAEGQ